MKKNLRVALVHDYLAEYGGAERVLEALHEVFPQAPLFTAFVDQDRLGVEWQKFATWEIHTSWLSKIPFHKKLFSPLRIFAPQFFRSFDLSSFDLVISSTNAYFAKAVQVPNGVHICYCHTPSRSLWGYSTMTDWHKNPLINFFGTLINHYLRVIDVQVARSNVDLFIANSQETKKRIAKFYKKSATVIYPPVNIPKLPPKTNRTGNYFLYVNRLALAKHPELAVQVCTQLNLPLKVVGSGKMLGELQSQAGPTIEFFGHVSDEKLASLYREAKALLYPVEDEDFGIVPIEAMAYGVPVIAHASGGPLESIIDGKTGILFEELSVAGLTKAIERLSSLSFRPSALYHHTQQFSLAIFKEKIMAVVTTQQRPPHSPPLE